MSDALTRRLAAGGGNGDATPSDVALPSSEDAAATIEAVSETQYPCVCRALLRSDAGPRLTFLFTALTRERVLATIEELPEVWAIGETITSARAALLVEMALLIAANPANAVPLAERKRLLRRETVILAPRRRS